jgi:DGQHR domain-containing protein
VQDLSNYPSKRKDEAVREMTTAIERPAAKIRQGNLVLYTTSLRVSDLRRPNFYAIDTLDVVEGTGYQRVLNEARAKRLADYLLEGHKALEAFLPTSLFLATDKLLPFDETKNLLAIDESKTGPFNVVDGQHRLRGLVLAAEKDPSLNEFEVPVNIAVGLSTVSQMAHFLIVNTTQKAVDMAIEQQIVARLTEMIDFEKTPVLPKWIQRQVDKGEDARALSIVSYLNNEPTSVWFGKIRMANDDDGSSDATINQKSFVASLKKLVLTPSNPISGPNWDADRQKKVLANYWRAITSLLVESSDESSVIFKTNGLHLFHGVSPAIFTRLANDRRFTVEAISDLLRHAFENLPTEFIAVSSPGFWKRGAQASGLNQAAIRKYATAIATSMHASSDFDGVTL